MNNYIKRPAKFGIGLTALLLMLVPGLIGLVLTYVGNTYHPCNTGAGTPGGLFGCDTADGNNFMLFRAIASWSLLFFSPLAIFTAVMAFIKNSGIKFAIVALILAVGFFFFPALNPFA